MNRIIEWILIIIRKAISYMKSLLLEILPKTLKEWILFLATIIGAIYGYLGYQQIASIEKIQRREAWSIVQTCKTAYTQFNNFYDRGRIDTTRKHDFAEAHARLEELYQKSIQHVFSQYAKVDTTLILGWVKEGRLPKQAYNDWARQISY